MAPSSAARLLFRPFNTYAALAVAPPAEAPTVVGGVVRLLFVIGAFVTITSTGRLAPFELVVAMGSYAYVAFSQFLALAIAVRIVSRTIPLRRAFAFYLAGHGPWLLALLGIAATCLLAQSPAAVLFALAPKVIPVVLVWSGVLTFACLKRGLGLSSVRAALATVIYVVALTSIILSYFAVEGQLVPLFKH